MQDVIPSVKQTFTCLFTETHFSSERPATLLKSFKVKDLTGIGAFKEWSDRRVQILRQKEEAGAKPETLTPVLAQ